MSGRRGRLTGALFTECAEWIWENLQEDGYFVAGELVELILETERALGVHTQGLETIASALEREFQQRGISSGPEPIGREIILAVLQWEDDFLGFAAIPRAES